MGRLYTPTEPCLKVHTACARLLAAAATTFLKKERPSTFKKLRAGAHQRARVPCCGTKEKFWKPLCVVRTIPVLQYSSHTARSGLGLARVVGLFAWPRHTNGMAATTPLDPCAYAMSAQGGDK